MTETTEKPLSGLELLRAMIAGKGRAPAISATLNFKAVAVEDGVVTFAGTPLEGFTNPIGTVHGGWYGAILDSCMACAILSKLPADTHYTTLEYKVNVIRPIPLGTEVTATGTAQHVGRSTGVAVGEIRDSDGRLYATGSTTCIVMQQR
ncbi:PaaI family thioesterase [Pseudooceanicola sediminis]|uniref:PaaI family thioesterase n=1 Tax=Pseudooceanicola sediminis TaxID=2211117 RepID=A0A399IXF9_9RHOB|nr:PaaI family thioesterase [Pseudooceanicola sediminis]KAA2313197.1 PaaI family thioesterase [Puniceibacterium sp. HSS470]RII37843.1 PaaI family thioesterase [Pseudooceanicola sediminis]|tara:strand:- start:62025 stop:62471 length:447 start_codon:yes stop_codon:yes gene_type:complete